MTPLIAANLAITAFNVALTICIWGLIIARVPPPDVSGWVMFSAYALVTLAIWLGVFGYTSATIT